MVAISGWRCREIAGLGTWFAQDGLAGWRLGKPESARHPSRRQDQLLRRTRGVGRIEPTYENELGVTSSDVPLTDACGLALSASVAGGRPALLRRARLKEASCRPHLPLDSPVPHRSPTGGQAKRRSSNNGGRTWNVSWAPLSSRSRSLTGGMGSRGPANTSRTARRRARRGRGLRPCAARPLTRSPS